MTQQMSREKRPAVHVPTPNVANVANLSDIQRLRRVEELGRNIAQWSTELNRRLA